MPASGRNRAYSPLTRATAFRRWFVTAHFDNSRNNPLNPDPTTPVRWGSQSENEMMDGWVEYVDTEVVPPESASR